MKLIWGTQRSYGLDKFCPLKKFKIEIKFRRNIQNFSVSARNFISLCLDSSQLCSITPKSGLSNTIDLGKFHFIFGPIPFYHFANSILFYQFCTFPLQFNFSGKILQILQFFLTNSILSWKFAKNLPNSATVAFFLTWFCFFSQIPFCLCLK